MDQSGRAEDWTGQGNADDPAAELEEVTVGQGEQPEALSLRWHTYRKAQKWHACMAVASALTASFSDNPCGWISMAQTLYHTHRIADAYDIGISKAKEFPDSCQLLYNTACYACLLGKRGEAEDYLRLAMTAGDADAIKQQALEDPDLAALWQPETD